MSVEMWVRRFSGDARLAGQLGGGPNDGECRWLLSLQDSKPKLEIWSGGGSQAVTSYRSINDTGWHLIMFSYDCGTTGKLYLDNELVGTLTTAGVWTKVDTTFEIGYSERIGGFNGVIDEVRISDVVRLPVYAAPPVAGFSAAQTSGIAPLQVTFTDQSSGNINAWSWNFGDGTTSTSQSPTHSFNAPGTFSVSLTVTGMGGSNTFTQSNYITVTAAPTPTPAPPPAPPSNDNFNSPGIIDSYLKDITSDTRGATTAVDDPSPSCGSGQNSNSIWYRFTPVVNGKMLFDTFGSDYDTVIAVWRGARGNLIEVGCNDNYQTGMQSQIEVSVNSGSPYYIEVMDFGNPLGGSLIGHFNFAASVLNDVFNNAVKAPSLPFSKTLNINGASTAADDPILTLPFASSQFYKTVWYKYIPSASGPLSIDTFGSDFDTIIGVWTGSQGALQSQAVNDDASGILQSLVEMDVTSGVTYYIEVASYSEQPSGNLQISLTRPTVLTISASPTQVYIGENITVKWGGLDPSGTDWISMHPAEQPDSNYLAWQYSNASSGTLSFQAPSSPGIYNFRLFRNGEKVITSNPVSVSVHGSVPKPVLQSPADNALMVGDSIKLDWGTVSMPSSMPFEKYQVQVAKDINFTQMISDQPVNDRVSSELLLSGLFTPNTKYYWWVRVFNTYGQYGNWSAIRSFRKTILPPTLSAPAIGELVSSRRPTFNWSVVTGASSYQIQISSYSNMQYPVVSTTISASQYTPGSNLPKNRTLYWRVRSKGVNGPSLWSEVRSFVTPNPPGTPSLLSPSANTLTRDYTPRLDWANSSLPSGTAFDHYQLQVARDSAFSDKVLDTSLYGLQNSEYTFSSDLASNTIYYWHVRAYNTLNFSSSWSATRTFRTALLPPTLVIPSDSTTVYSQRPAFDWNTVSGAGSYQIQVSRNAGFSTTLVNATITSSDYIPNTNLPKNVGLYWRVRAKGANGPSIWSLARMVTIN